MRQSWPSLTYFAFQSHATKGQAVVVSDVEVFNILQRPSRAGVTLTNLWQTSTTPAEFDSD